MPKVAGGLGVSIVSTNKGVMTDRASTLQNVGGEVICTVSLRSIVMSRVAKAPVERP